MRYTEAWTKSVSADIGSLYWSQDRKWLVYHVYDVHSNISFPKQYSIYKVNAETGETTRLVKSRLFP